MRIVLHRAVVGMLNALITHRSRLPLEHDSSDDFPSL